MTLYRCHLGFNRPCKKRDAEKFVLEMVKELVGLGHTSFYIATPTNNHLPWYVTIEIESDEEQDARNRAITAVRSSVHAAGGNTRDWPSLDDPRLQ